MHINNRYVHPSLSIVLSDYHRLFYNDKLMPTGHLREPISNINRTDIVVVTKCERRYEADRFSYY